MGVQRVHANDAYCMFFLIAQNLYILFYKIYRFTTLFSFKLSLLLNLRFLLHPILIMMQLRIMLYTYCTPLQSCTAISTSIVHEYNREAIDSFSSAIWTGTAASIWFEIWGSWITLPSPRMTPMDRQELFVPRIRTLL